MKDRVISELRRELQLLESSADTAERDMHIYAMERLLEVLKRDPSLKDHMVPVKDSVSDDDKMLEMMGGTPVKKKADHASGKERERTDDGFGNGESIFDF